MEESVKNDGMKRRAFLQLAAGAAALGSTRGLAKPDASGAGERSDALDLTAAGFHALRRFAELPQGSIAYLEQGSGPAALFLHGFPLNSFQWRGAIPRLSHARRCIAADFMGLGYTRPAAGQKLAPADQAAMLIALLDSLKVDRADLVANDSGGAVAQLLVARWPERVRSLLITNCDVEPDCPPAAVRSVIEASRAGRWVDEGLVPVARNPARGREKDGIGPACYEYAGSPTDEAIGVYFEPLVRNAAQKRLAEGYALGLEANALAGTEPALRRATLPVRIIWGEADAIFAAGNPAFLERVFSGSRGVRRLPTAKLFWPEERPELIAEEALRLWKA
jgi:pimeloyl-ACP methyl ester carboxylesterase